MDMMQELYDAHAHSLEAEEALSTSNKELTDFIESNISPDEKTLFLDTLESVITKREHYFFQAGFYAAKDLLLK